MARTDTLGNFLTDVASAIKEKKGSADAISADTFDDEIRNLPSGSSGPIGAIKFLPYDTSVGITSTGLTEDEAATLLENILKSKPVNMTMFFQNCNITNLQRWNAMNSNFDFSNCTKASYCFSNCKMYISNGHYYPIFSLLKNINNLVDTSYMFSNFKLYSGGYDTYQIELGLNNVDLSHVLKGDHMFYHTYNSSYKTPAFLDLDLKTFKPPIQSSYLFAYAGNSSDNKQIRFKKSEDTKMQDVSHVTDFSYAFTNVVMLDSTKPGTNFVTFNWRNVDLSSCTNMSYMFNLSNNPFVTGDMKQIDMTNMYAPNCVNMSNMFTGRENTEQFLFENVTVAPNCSFSNMFYRCSAATFIDISNFDITSATTSNILGPATSLRSSYYVPADCTIIVKDQTSYDNLMTKYPWLTNVNIVD